MRRGQTVFLRRRFVIPHILRVHEFLEHLLPFLGVVVRPYCRVEAGCKSPDLFVRSLHYGARPDFITSQIDLLVSTGIPYISWYVRVSCFLCFTSLLMFQGLSALFLCSDLLFSLFFCLFTLLFLLLTPAFLGFDTLLLLTG